MAIKLPANLCRNRYGILYFRIAVPKDIRHHFATAEIYKSLQTGSVRLAVHDAQALTIAFRRVFLCIRQQSMSDEKGTPQQPLIDPAKLEDLIRFTKMKMRYQDERNQLADEVTEGIHQLAKLKALHHREQSALKAQYERELELVLKARHSTGSVFPSDGTKNISSYIAIYIESIRARKRPKPPSEQTIASYEASARLFVEIIGDKLAHELGHKDKKTYDEVIFRIPKNRHKMPATRGKSLAEMVAMPGLETLSASTAKDEALRVNLFLEWVFDSEGAKPPFKLLEKFKVESEDVQKRRTFSDVELAKIFEPMTLNCDKRPSPYKYWLTLIAVHTGARINEIAQLHLSDIVVIDDIPCFNITNESDDSIEAKAVIKKAVKTEAGKRIVPIHCQLIELGLLDYVKALREHNHLMLFPDLSHAKIKYGMLASKWFANYCNSLGLTDSALTFHSFRHGVVTLLAKNNVQRELRKLLVGHSHYRDTHDIYVHVNGMFNTAAKQVAINTLDFREVINYADLRPLAPDLEDLNKALNRTMRKGN